ncbi:hypothetical protein EIN_487760 [Entamoeba invadens IP1]|uniref:Uncharacterized protein n=1 Tax=Entamoeba invadens IP1 TaxID=370355 RepID=A0A0A1U506_ENTIV|nr:hypothetical protein EIN_487760 [Entamoeba invadens IP1]ELP89274.1 hypothetical protein EIN_487760 [Entamoeba invadens IP1]|eukprot:XP_004256045.1 hypothetical protein EIN_487760 [Entamoeba invadens IP1]
MTCCSVRKTTVQFSTPEDHVISNCVRSKRDMKNFEAIQESYLLGLLNAFCSFTFEKPAKKSKVTFQFVKTTTLHFGQDVVRIRDITEANCKCRAELERSVGVSEDKVKRRFDKNKNIFLTNMLFDFALEYGYFFNSKLARNTGGAIQMDKIKDVFYNGELVCQQSDMMIRGIALNKYFSSLTVNEDKQGRVSQYDLIISKILTDPLYKVQRDWSVEIIERRGIKANF